MKITNFILQVSLTACISNDCRAQEPTTCCSQTKSSQV